MSIILKTVRDRRYLQGTIDPGSMPLKKDSRIMAAILNVAGNEKC